MVFLRFFLIFGGVILCFGWIDHFGIVRTDVTHIVRGGKSLVLLHDGMLHEAPDEYTVEALGSRLFDPSANVSAYELGEPIRSLKMASQTPDEVMRTTILKAMYSAPPLAWLSMASLGPMINPSMALWKGYLIICFKLAIEQDVLLRVLNASTLQEVRDSDVSFQKGGNCSTNTGLKSWDFIGEDVRMVPLSDGRLNFIITSHHEWFYRMFSSKASISPSLLFSSRPRFVTFEQMQWFTKLENGHFPRHWTQNQKNWVPFENNGTLYFVQNFNPLHILKLVEKGDPSLIGQEGCGPPTQNFRLPGRNESREVYSQVVSTAALLNLEWDFGALRGGTPGLLLPGGKYYLALFHNRHHIPGNLLETYFMGAVTWCANASDFRLYSMSKSPIVNISLYDGAWTPNRRGPSRIDYVVFPMGLILDAGGESITISLGHQDVEGIIATIGLTSLLRSMKVVGSPC